MNNRDVDKKMQEATEERSELCARAEEMVAYLYLEASQTEAKDFEAHMQHCASCRTELAAFGQVRGSIDEWRRQSLGTLGAHAFGTEAVPTALDATIREQPRERSALAALREFFTLSPMWMRAATAVASVCVCALVVLAVARAEVRWDTDGFSFRTGLSRERVVERTLPVEVEKPVKVGYSQEELNQIVADRIRQERESFQKQQPTQKARMTLADTRSRVAMTTTAAARTPPQSSSRTPARTPVRQTVAEANRLDEEDLPRLYDLLGESN
jgi:anti-sigma factor RsiW